MKRLLILRHAKSSWKDSGLSDYDRPLNKRGRRSAPLMGNWIAHHSLQPDVIICSTAIRAQETFHLICNSADWDGESIHTEDLYLAPPQTYLDYLAQLPEQVESAMVIGHNPGIEALVYGQCGEYHTMPTCALAIIDFDILTWNKLLTGSVSGELQHHILVRELE
ncbi:MAG: phosphohistidine phosphatase [Planctomycetaceae bacterium]|nr:phosphohistidine phosphatase [Planctomycetaceae bacterium]|tara:strand:+ start:559 stop:1053 length:495 start_codon:yes stop_codon:yes gene_type:complete